MKEKEGETKKRDKKGMEEKKKQESAIRYRDKGGLEGEAWLDVGEYKRQ